MKQIKKIGYTIMILVACLFMFSKIVKAANVKVTTDTLNLREKPSTDSDILTLLSNGDSCELLSEEGDWYKIKYNNYTGYITKEYAKKEGTSNTSESSEKDTKNEPEDKTENNPILLI